MTDEPRKSQVNKAASTVRKWYRDEISMDDPRIDRALDVIDAYRSLHSKPLVSVNVSLRRMLAAEDCPVEVTQRLKRFPTMLDKLQREPTLPLSKMQDIGGVRAILENVDQIRRVEARIKRLRTVLGYKDYIATPRASGYRGVHVVVEYHGRSIEIQLRTRVMHEWAVTVERLSGRRGENYKRDGESPIQTLMATISLAMAAEELGFVVSDEILDSMKRLRISAGL